MDNRLKQFDDFLNAEINSLERINEDLKKVGFDSGNEYYKAIAELKLLQGKFRSLFEIEVR